MAAGVHAAGDLAGKPEPASSGIGNASMSPRKRIVRPLCEAAFVLGAGSPSRMAAN
jgi:hypothetical protein